MKKVAASLGFLFLLAFLYWGWPTPWIYDRIPVAAGFELPVRVNRFTGHVDTLSFTGWYRFEGVKQADPPAPINPLNSQP